MSLLLAILAGFVFPYSGYKLQRAFSNQLIDVYSIGLGALICTAAALSSVIGMSMQSLSLIFGVAFLLVTSIIKLFIGVTQFITFGLVIGSLLGAIGTILCNNLDPESLAAYYHWTGATYQNTDGFIVTITLVILGFIISRKNSRILVYFGTGLMCLGMIYSVGIIWVISLVAPNLAKLTNYNEHVRMYIAILVGVVLSVSTWYVTFYITDIYLPVSATMSILTIPIYTILVSRSAN